MCLRTLVVGDSLAVGLYPFIKDMAANDSKSRMPNDPFQTRLEAKSGTTTAYWASNEQLKRTVAELDPTLVLVSLGTNDSRTNYSAEELADQIRELSRVLHNDAEFFTRDVIWILPPTLPFPDGDRGFSELVRNQPGQRVFPSAELDIPRTSDGIHPTGAGYRGWAAQIWQRQCASPNLSFEWVEWINALAIIAAVGIGTVILWRKL